MNLTQVSEVEWLRALGELPPWTVPDRPMLVVSPHPDDETLGCGGLIATARRRGTRVLVVAVTDGENAYPGEEGGPGLADRRRKEQAAALLRLEVGATQIVRLGLTDSSVGAHEAELTERLTQLSTAETVIVAPWEGDFHPDHEACGRAALTASQRTGAQVVSYFFWSWHRGTTELLRAMPLSELRLDEQTLQAKTEALECHRSQLTRALGPPILPAELLGPARRHFEVFWIR